MCKEWRISSLQNVGNERESHQSFLVSGDDRYRLVAVPGAAILRPEGSAGSLVSERIVVGEVTQQALDKVWRVLQPGDLPHWPVAKA